MPKKEPIPLDAARNAALDCLTFSCSELVSRCQLAGLAESDVVKQNRLIERAAISYIHEWRQAIVYFRAVFTKDVHKQIMVANAAAGAAIGTTAHEGVFGEWQMLCAVLADKAVMPWPAWVWAEVMGHKQPASCPKLSFDERRKWNNAFIEQLRGEQHVDTPPLADQISREWARAIAHILPGAETWHDDLHNRIVEELSRGEFWQLRPLMNQLENIMDKCPSKETVERHLRDLKQWGEVGNRRGPHGGYYLLSNPPMPNI